MPTLITTPGAADANSYATVEEADEYHDGRLHDDAWDNADKEAALVWAALLLDGWVVWTGQATYETQALVWPRKGMFNRNGFAIPETVIPREIKAAQSELARQLALNDLMADDDVRRKDIRSLSAGSVSISFGGRDRTRDYLGVFPDVTSETIPDALLILLVPSWYVRADTGPRFMFETVDY
jgi:hypothetical protein